jgi:hypothetical protein
MAGAVLRNDGLWPWVDGYQLWVAVMREDSSPIGRGNTFWLGRLLEHRECCWSMRKEINERPHSRFTPAFL